MADGFDDQKILGAGFDRRLIRRLMGYLYPRRYAMALLLCIATLAVLFNQVWILIIGRAIDGPIASGDRGSLLSHTVLLAVCVTAGTLLNLCQNYMGTAVATRTVNHIRVKLYRHLQYMHMQFYHRNPVGRLLTRVTSDIDALNEFFQEGMVSFFTNLLKVVVIMAILLHTHAFMALITFLCIPLMVWLSVVFKQKSREAFRDTRLSIANLNSYLQENISGMQEVQAFNRQEKNATRFAALAEDYRDKNYTTIFYFATFFPLMEFVSALGLTLAMAAAALFVGVGGVSVGTLVIFFASIDDLFEPIREMADKYNVLQSAMASSERVFKILDTPAAIVDKDGVVELTECRGEIEFQNVWFAYNDEDWVLRDLSLTIRAGEKVAFVGHTGAGKSTLVSLLLRFYEPQKGRILLDGRDLSDYSLASLRAAIGMVLQDPFLFRRSVLENIRLGDETIPREAVEQACRYVGADKFLRALPQGYDTPLTERGASLSVGQRQLLSMARALVHEPRLLILDEATSHVDPETEAQLQEALRTLIRDRNAIVIAHRLSTVEEADTLFVLHRGRLEEQGAHRELLEQNGIYAKLHQLQYRAAPAKQGS